MSRLSIVLILLLSIAVSVFLRIQNDPDGCRGEFVYEGRVPVTVEIENLETGEITQDETFAESWICEDGLEEVE